MSKKIIYKNNKSKELHNFASFQALVFKSKKIYSRDVLKKICEYFHPINIIFGENGHLITCTKFDNTLKLGFCELPEYSYRFTTSKCIQDDVYFVCGGYGLDPTQENRKTFLVNAATTTAVRAADMPETRYSHTSTVLDDGNILIVGGNIEFCKNIPNKVYKTATIYNIQQRTWEKIMGNLNIERHSHSSTLMHDGCVLITGGKNDANYKLNSCEIFNPNTKSFTMVAPMKYARFDHASITLKDGRVLVCSSKKCEIYSNTDDCWRETGDLINFHMHTYTVLLPNGFVLIYGGLYADCEIFNTITERWQLAREFNVTWQYHSLCS